ncbi:MAG: hypothetical protein BWY93_02262 [Euryarchaeota archaeon ADurb.BinA087]|nr:MAG: hypothetical protein BWY93_02262 [Euryarchaeota archaeon ADurb.BinA087]
MARLLPSFSSSVFPMIGTARFRSLGSKSYTFIPRNIHSIGGIPGTDIGRFMISHFWGICLFWKYWGKRS